MGLESPCNKTGKVKEYFYFSLIFVQITIVGYRIERGKPILSSASKLFPRKGYKKRGIIQPDSKPNHKGKFFCKSQDL